MLPLTGFPLSPHSHAARIWPATSSLEFSESRYCADLPEDTPLAATLLTIAATRAEDRYTLPATDEIHRYVQCPVLGFKYLLKHSSSHSHFPGLFGAAVPTLFFFRLSVFFISSYLNAINLTNFILLTSQNTTKNNVY